MLRQTRETEEQWGPIRSRSVHGVTEYRRQFGEDPAGENDFKAYYKNGSADAVAKAANFSARPPRRGGADHAHHTARAIGYNLALNIAGSCAPLYLGMANYLSDTGWDDRTNFSDIRTILVPLPDPQNLEALYHQASASPKVQEMLLRSAYGLAMADFNTAWGYYGCSYDSQNNLIIDDQGESFTIADLLHCDMPEARQLARFQIEHMIVLPVVTALLHDIQHQQGPQELNALANTILGAAQAARGSDNINTALLNAVHGYADREALLHAMPAGLSEELYWQIPLADQARERVLRFRDSISTGQFPEGQFPEGYEDIHAAINACVEIFERAPSYFMDAALLGSIGTHQNNTLVSSLPHDF